MRSKLIGNRYLLNCEWPAWVSDFLPWLNCEQIEKENKEIADGGWNILLITDMVWFVRWGSVWEPNRSQPTSQNVAACLSSATVDWGRPLHARWRKDELLLSGQVVLVGRSQAERDWLMLPKVTPLRSDFLFLGGEWTQVKTEPGAGNLTCQEIARIEEAMFITTISTS